MDFNWRFILLSLAVLIKETCGQPLQTLDKSADDVYGVGWSPTSQYVATSDKDGWVYVYDVTAGGILVQEQQCTSAVDSACFSADGKYVVGAAANGAICVWAFPAFTIPFDGTVKTGTTVTTFTTGPTSIWFMDCSTTKNWVAAGDSSGANFAVFNLDTLQRAALWPVANGKIKAVAFNADSTQVATVGDSGVIAVYSIADGSQVIAWAPKPAVTNNIIHDIDWSVDGKYICVGSSTDNTAQIYTAATGLLKFQLSPLGGTPRSCSFSPDTTQVAIGLSNKNIAVYSTITGALMRNLVGHTDLVESVKYSPNGVYIASGSDDDKAMIWAGQDSASASGSLSPKASPSPVIAIPAELPGSSAGLYGLFALIAIPVLLVAGIAALLAYLFLYSPAGVEAVPVTEVPQQPPVQGNYMQNYIPQPYVPQGYLPAN